MVELGDGWGIGNAAQVRMRQPEEDNFVPKGGGKHERFVLGVSSAHVEKQQQDDCHKGDPEVHRIVKLAGDCVACCLVLWLQAAAEGTRPVQAIEAVESPTCVEQTPGRSQGVFPQVFHDGKAAGLGRCWSSQAVGGHVQVWCGRVVF